MIFELAIGIGITMVLIAFLAEYVDSTLGMGYGTTLTPLLLLMGFSPLQIVPTVLLSELFTGLLAAFMHHRVGNVKFDFRNDPESRIKKRLGKLGYMPRSKESKVAIVLALCSIIGTILAVFIAVNLPKFYLKLYIGILVSVMGIIILARHKKSHKFSWKKIIGLGAVASFNKGLSGGGYGPVVTSGQILSGIDSKASISITSLAEGLTCFVGVITYIILNINIDWILAPYLITGAIASVPLSAYTVKKIKTKKFTLIIGIATLFLGLFTLAKLFL